MSKFIDIKSTDKKDERVSTFQVIERDNSLRVMGNLPHGYYFTPNSKKDAQELIEYLQAWIANN